VVPEFCIPGKVRRLHAMTPWECQRFAESSSLLNLADASYYRGCRAPREGLAMREIRLKRSRRIAIARIG
jgi:hypothetical protein